VGTVGILALQGDVEAHAAAIGALGHVARPVKSARTLEAVEALVLPGGESTTMLKLLHDEALFAPLQEACRSGRPVFGTCAGTILLARHVTHPEQASLDALDIDVQRNAYGRQRDSFVTRLEGGPPGLDDLEAVFIRAPIIRRVGAQVEVVLRHREAPVLVRSGAVWAATFHPEMTSDRRLLARILEPLA